MSTASAVERDDGPRGIYVEQPTDSPFLSELRGWSHECSVDLGGQRSSRLSAVPPIAIAFQDTDVFVIGRKGTSSAEAIPGRSHAKYRFTELAVN